MTPQSVRVLTRGEEALRDRLLEERARIHDLTVRLREAKRCRNLLIGKARLAKFTVREIEKLAGVSNVRVSQIALPSPVVTQEGES